jgi:hypothetical protein
MVKDFADHIETSEAYIQEALDNTGLDKVNNF